MEVTHTFAVTAYKESEYLEACLRSLKAQTVPSNIIITTSTPNRHIEQLAKKYDIPMIVNQGEPGIATDWKFAVDQCTTPYVTIAHQDDLYYPEYTEKLLPNMEGTVISFCNYEETVDDDKVRSNTKLLKIKRMLLWPFLFKKKLKSRFAKRSILRLGSPICCPSVMYNRELCGGPTFDAEYRNDLDWDAWLRFADMKGAFYYSREILMSHRIHEGSETTKQIASSGRAKEDARMFERLWWKPIAKLLTKLYSKSYDSNGQK